jgi:hypothetical protein
LHGSKGQATRQTLPGRKQPAATNFFTFSLFGETKTKNRLSKNRTGNAPAICMHNSLKGRDKRQQRTAGTEHVEEPVHEFR